MICNGFLLNVCSDLIFYGESLSPFCEIVRKLASFTSIEQEFVSFPLHFERELGAF